MEAGGLKEGARSAEEEALKRSTDCVYFLASPLTCKKGVECDYRHSEGARMNPRDCWFWLNGNCLNSKCSFRHPPLDSLIGSPSASGPALPLQPKVSVQTSLALPSGAQNPVKQSVPPTFPVASQNSGKQSIPCFYFQRGTCLKADRCPFAHGPASAPTPNPVSQQVPKVTVPVTDPPQPIRKTPRILDRVSPQNIPRDFSNKPTEIAPSSAKPHAKTDTTTNGLLPKNTQFNVEFPSRSGTSGIPPGSGNMASRSPSRQSDPMDDEYQNDREGEEHVRESSPGFDVLVDDETEEPGYFCDDDEFGGVSGHDGRSMNPGADYDYPRSSDYENISKFRGEPYNDGNESGRHVNAEEYLSREHRGAFSDRNSSRQSDLDKRSRRRLRRENDPTMIDGSDLRLQLLKKRKVNATRSAAGPDSREYSRSSDRHFEEQRHRSHDRRMDHRSGLREITSKRLQGRISLPRRFPEDSNRDMMYPDREIDRGRSWGRSSPGRPSSYHQRKLHDRINRRSSDSSHSDDKNIRAPTVRNDEPGTVNFTGPKSLLELKSMKASHTSEQRLVGTNSDGTREQRSLKLAKPLGHQDTESVPFKSPQPLSVILQKKREAAAANNAHAEESGDHTGHESPSVSPGTSAAGTRIRQSEPSRNDNQALDPEADAVDVEEDDPMMGIEDVQTYAEDVNGVEEEGLDYNDEENYEQGDEYYQEDEYVDYEAEGGEEVYEEVEGAEAEGGEEVYEEVEGAEGGEDVYEDVEGKEDGGDDFAKVAIFR